MPKFFKNVFKIRKKHYSKFEVLLGSLDNNFRTPLLSMYRGESQLGKDGKRHIIDIATKISPTQGIWLYELCLSLKPKFSLEIGMAYGYSTIYFLASIAKNQIGHHTAIDPYQNSDWHGIGLTHVKKLAPTLGKNSSFQFIEDRSVRVATDLARSDSVFDLIFIDGNHRFDDVLVDFYLYAQLCNLGGYIIFDDMWLGSVQTVVSFVRANRTDFVEVHTTEKNVCVFQKKSHDSRKWDDFHKFSVSRGKE